jgi:hypothetical protein
VETVPTSDVEYGLHGAQCSILVLAVIGRYVSAGQFAHELIVAFLYLPAAHAVHVPPSGPLKPALHVQEVRVALAEGDELLVGHVSHVCAPEVLLYFPASHATHEPPLGPVYPATHEQLKKPVL